MKNNSVNWLSILGLLLFLSCKSHTTSFNPPIDHFVIFSTLALINTAPIPCSEDDNLTRRRISFEFVIRNRDRVEEIHEHFKRLKVDDTYEPFSSTLVLIGYHEKNEVLRVCTSSRLTTDYIIGGKRYAMDSDFNSILASLVLEKFQAGDFSCTGENEEDCDNIKENLFLMEDDYKAISVILTPVIEKSQSN
jgi:hypothetical protein